MPEMRLIDANALDKALVQVFMMYNDVSTMLTLKGVQVYNAAIDAARRKAREAATIDAVPVVRCRECKHWSGRKDKPGEVTAIGYCDHPNHRIMPLNANWFCADGVKMDGGAEG